MDGQDKELVFYVTGKGESLKDQAGEWHEIKSFSVKFSISVFLLPIWLNGSSMWSQKGEGI
jgi:hypothetical protein